MTKRPEKKISWKEFVGDKIPSETLPTHSTGKDFAKSRGKDLRECVGPGGKTTGGFVRDGGGKARFGRNAGRYDDKPTRAIYGDWHTKVVPGEGVKSSGKHFPPSIGESDKQRVGMKTEEEKTRTDRPRAYVPPHKKAQMEKEAEARQAREAETERQKAREEAEKENRRKENERRKQQEKEQYLRQKREAAEKARTKPARKTVVQQEEYDEEKLNEFSQKCFSVVFESAYAYKLAMELEKHLDRDQLKTLHPVKALCQHLLEYCRRRNDAEVIGAVKNAAPIFKALIDLAQDDSYKVKMLCEIQRICSRMGLPRLSPASALLEVFLDGLYQADVVEEGSFEMWAFADDDTPGKTTAMFQVSHFLDWLREAGIDGASTDGGDGDSDDASDSDDDDLAAYDNPYGSRVR